ncbi:MAG: hypothetical protein ACR2M0_05010 [Chloroflexia bacterium]
MGDGPTPGTRDTQAYFRAAPYDWQVRIITAMFALGLLWFGGEVVLSLLAGVRPQASFLVFAFLIGGAMLWRWMNSVRGYAIQAGGENGPVLLVRRVAPWAVVPISLTRLRSAEADLKISNILNLSIFGLGSLFGWAGPATVREMGQVLAFATSSRSVVLLELTPDTEERTYTSGGKEARGPMVLVSPRDPAALAAALAPFCRTPGLSSVARPPARSVSRPAKKRR